MLLTIGDYSGLFLVSLHSCFTHPSSELKSDLQIVWLRSVQVDRVA